MDKVIPVRVAVRCRPLISKELTEGCQLCVRFTPNEPQIIMGVDKAFTYDFVFSPQKAQDVVYNESVKPLIRSIMKGCNATVLAYGQTGSGKTYTMGGCFATCSSQEEDENDLGVIPRVLQELFNKINMLSEEKHFQVKVSYLEIHNEDLNDLLCPPSKRESLSIREELQGAIKIQGLREVLVTSYEETLRCFAQGSLGRTTGSTAMNTASSRSHAIFTIHIEQTSKKDAMDILRSKFHLVDLAGSERAKRTMAEGERFKEGININKGLLALGNVISALGEESQKRNYIPYRDSKLTRLLQDSLGGNSDTLMIACVSPADSNLEETLNTLRYADRARKIKNKPVINRDPQTAEIMRLKSLVQELQVQLFQGGTNGTTNNVLSQNFINSNNNSANDKNLMDKLKALEEENNELSQELQKLVDQNTKTLERAIHLEMVRDKLKGKLREFKLQTGVDFELLSTSIDVEANPNVKEELEKLKRLAETLKSQSDSEKEDNLFSTEGEESEEDDVENLPCTPDTRAISNQYALRQAQMGRELEELNKLLARKEELANQMSHNDSKMDTVREHYEQTVKEMESKVAELQREKEQMSQALMDARTNTAASKVSEQRRRRLQELESQISNFKRKINEQNKMLKMKDQSEKQVYKLNSDIQAMKQQRVKLMKQMKEDAEQFRKWKQQKDKEVLQLQQKGRKQQFEMAKMQKNHEKQQNVLRRKAEEAAAANKRLKDALARQKAVMEERSQKLDKYDSTSIGKRVRSWLSHELDVRVGINEAKYHLSSLLNDRKLLTSQLTELKNTEKDIMADKSFDEEAHQKEIKLLETEIELRNVQIADLQQKIVDADQDSKGKSTWENLHTMTEAKIALKWLLDQAVAAKADVSVTRSELKDVQEVNMDVSHSAEKLESEIKNLKQQHEQQITAVQREHEEKILYLLCQLNADSEKINTSLDDEIKKKLKFQETEIEKFKNLHEQLQQKTEENEILKKQLTRAMYQGKKMALMPSLSEPGTSPFLTPVPKPTRKPKKKQKEEEVLTLEELFDDWDDIPSDKESDSDWQPTPLYKRKKPRITKKKQSSSILSSESSSMNSTFSVDVDQSNSFGSKKHRRRTKVVLLDSDENIRSSEEFQKSPVKHLRKRNSKGKQKTGDTASQESEKTSSQEEQDENSDKLPALKGGVKKRRLLNKDRSSLFTPLS